MLKLSAAAILILSAVVATGAACAGQQGPSSTSLTRGEVRSAVLAARADGTLDRTETNYPRELTAGTSTVIRAQVKAEAIRARAAGELDWTDTTYPFSHAQKKSQVTRAEVAAEVIRARKAGELDISEATPAGRGRAT
jgi:hypothetical protein